MRAGEKASVRGALLHTRMGVAGLAMLGMLALISASAGVLGFSEHVREWNDPTAWLSYPKSAVPSWANIERLAEHLVIEGSDVQSSSSAGVWRHTTYHTFEVREGGLPSGIIYEYAARYSGSPLLELVMFLDDDRQIELASVALPASEQEYEYRSQVFSTDAAVRKLVEMQTGDARGVESALFGDGGEAALEGTYTLAASLYDLEGKGAAITDSTLIVGGGAFGIMGTDELRRDVAIGLFWGTPLALFVGVTVAVASVMMGLMYGMYAGYRGGRRDEAMMRLNDVVYALPALPFLVILGVTISSSIFVTVGFLVVFGWVGIAKVSRSMALQARARGYVEASKMMGQRDSRTIIRHIMPQLLPYALASIAISVPAAITTEAGLSFLGLGDPEYPTWGSMLQDANNHGAAARGLWWWIVPPGMMIAITGLAFVFIGGAIDRTTNPRQGRLG